MPAASRLARAVPEIGGCLARPIVGRPRREYDDER
jgi:hypothetical protein